MNINIYILQIYSIIFIYTLFHITPIHTLQYNIWQPIHGTTGDCTDQPDIIIYNSFDINQFNSIINQCARDSFGDIDSSTACIEQHTKLSHPCCICYGNDIGCMSSNCMMECIDDDKSVQCIQCHTQHCLHTLQSCTGITHAQIEIQ